MPASVIEAMKHVKNLHATNVRLRFSHITSYDDATPVYCAET